MVDLKLLRREPDRVRAALARRGAAGAVDDLLQLDARRRELLPQAEGLRAQRNEASEAIGQAKRSGEDASDAIAQMREIGSQIKALDAELAQVEAALDAKLATLPNLPDPTAADEDDVVKDWGEPRTGGRNSAGLGVETDPGRVGRPRTGSYAETVPRRLVPPASDPPPAWWNRIQDVVPGPHPREAR